MFQLYKKRLFSDYINDTFNFFKITGKHFFKNYLNINGILLLITVVLMFFVFKVYFDFTFSKLANGVVQNNNQIQNLIENNSGVIIFSVIFGILLLMLISLLQFAFPVLYLKIMDEKKGTNFGTPDIIKELKKSTFKLIKFSIGAVFILFPLSMLIIVINVFLCFLIIGFPLFLITIPALMSWIHLIFYHYISSEDNFFGSFGAAFGDLKQQFWPIVFSTLIMYIIIQIVNTIFTMIPYVFGMASILTSAKDVNNSNENYTFMSTIMTLIFIISMLVSYILNNLILINQGMVYYSQRDYDENISESSSIDTIGLDCE